jgi:hypothetical protein
VQCYVRVTSRFIAHNTMLRLEQLNTALALVRYVKTKTDVVSIMFALQT